MKQYIRKIVSLLIALMVLFTVIAIYSVIQFKREKTIFSIGIPYYIEDIMIFALSIIALTIIIIDLYKIETKVGPRIILGK